MPNLAAATFPQRGAANEKPALQKADAGKFNETGTLHQTSYASPFHCAISIALLASVSLNRNCCNAADD